MSSFAAHMIGILSQTEEEEEGLIKLTTNSSEVVGGPHTDFPVFVNLANMPSRFWTTVKNGGGDIRCYADQDKTMQLAREVVSCDKVNQTGELWVKIPSLSSSTVFYLEADGVSNEPSPESTYGSESVWDQSNVLGVWHDAGGNDSSPNGNHATSNGSISIGDSIGKVGTSTEFDGNDDYTEPPNILGGLTSHTYGGWFYVRRDGNRAIGVEDTVQFSSVLFTDSGEWEFAVRDSTTTKRAGDGIQTVIQNQWQHVWATWDGSNIRLYVDGQLIDTTSCGSNRSPQDFTIGRWNQDGEHLDGFIDEVRAYNNAVSGDWIETEYNNQNNPSNFWIIE